MMNDDLYTMDEMMMTKWKNSTCLGYVIAALENLDYEPERITEVVSELIELFDWLSVREADELYADSMYQ